MKARVSGREMDVAVLADSNTGTLRVRIDGEELSVEAIRTADGRWSILLGGRSYDVTVEEAGEGDGHCGALIRGRLLEVDLEDPRRFVPSEAAAALEGWTEVRAPMPGKVVTVLVEEGQAVEAGEGLVVVEAMKMENELRSPKAGTVVRLPVRAGQAVEAGEVLAAVE